MANDSLVDAVVRLLRLAPDSWANVPKDLSSDEQTALNAITAAGFVERRITFTVQLPDEKQAQRITMEATGESGLADAMGSVVQDWWARWGQRWQDLRQELGEPIKPIVTQECDAWRLSDDGRLAKGDLERGEQRPVDFALKRGFFDGAPRLLPGGWLTRREPVRGHGRLVSIENVEGKPLAVNVVGFPAASEVAQAFAKVIERIWRSAPPPPAPPPEASAPADATDPIPKRSTERGEGRAKLIAALTKHHQYADGGCLKVDPIGNNELAKAAGVSASTASAFFNDKFQGHTKYKALCRDAGKLTAALKLLNDEFAPYHLLGAATSDLAAPEEENADDE